MRKEKQERNRNNNQQQNIAALDGALEENQRKTKTTINLCGDTIGFNGDKENIKSVTWMQKNKNNHLPDHICAALDGDQEENKRNNYPVWQRAKIERTINLCTEKKISCCSKKQNTAPDRRETKDERKQQLTCCSHAFQCLGVLQCFPMPSGVSPHLLGVPMPSTVVAHPSMPTSWCLLPWYKKTKQYYLRERKTKQKQKQQSAAEKPFSDGAPEENKRKQKQQSIFVDWDGQGCQNWCFLKE